MRISHRQSTSHCLLDRVATCGSPVTMTPVSHHKARLEKPHSKTLMRPSPAITVLESRRATRSSVRWGLTRNRTPLGRWTSLTCSSDCMAHRTFSGREIVKVMVNSGIYEWDRTNGDHAILRWNRPQTTIRTRVLFRSRYTTRSIWGRCGASPSRPAQRISTTSARGSSVTVSSTDFMWSSDD